MAKRGGGGKKAGGKKGGAKAPRGRFAVIDGGAGGDAAAKAAATAKRVGEHALISATALKSLLREDTRIKGEVDSLVGELRGEIKNAVDKKGLDKKAYAMLKSLVRMTPEKANAVYHNFLAYMDLSGELARIDAVQNLPLETENKAKLAGGDGDADEVAGIEQERDEEQQFGNAGIAPVH